MQSVKINWGKKVFIIISFILTLLLYFCSEDQAEKSPASQFYYKRFLYPLFLYTDIGAVCVEVLLKKRNVISKVHNFSDKDVNNLNLKNIFLLH